MARGNKSNSAVYLTVRTMTASKSLNDNFEQYTPEQRDALMQDGLKYRRGLMAAGRISAAQKQAKVSRRRSEIVRIFAGLHEMYRNRPCSVSTMFVVREELKRIGITASERTLMRDYHAIGGEPFLRAANTSTT